MSFRRLGTALLAVALAGGALTSLHLLLSQQPAYAAGVRYVAPGSACGGATPCYASPQAALDAAAAGDEIRVAAGAYTGVSVRSGATQTLYIDKSVTIRGGYTTANWSTPDPTANPTTLDAQGQGRVIYAVGEITVTLEGLRITGGDAQGLGGGAPGIDTGGGIT